MSTYRVLVTGSQEFDEPEIVYRALREEGNRAYICGYRQFVVVHGKCPRGADKFAAEWCRFPHSVADMLVIEEPHPAVWRIDGVFNKAAGFTRNAEMVALGANHCLAFYKQGAGNRGTGHCVALADVAGIPVMRFYA